MGKKLPMRLPHPRNIYRERPNIKELALQFPEFRQYAIQGLNGKVSMDFKNRDALCALTKVLLKKDFGLTVDIPSNRLVPTLPLRLNYLLWIEDLVQNFPQYLKPSSTVYGIDIGTGASCVYALLAACKNGYKMLATEADEMSFDYACRNVAANGLENLVEVKKVNQDTFLCGIVDAETVYDFCMCNPPFFSLEDKDKIESDKTSNRTGRRLPPKSAPTGSAMELAAPGGEVAFIQNIINDSFQLKHNIKLYTSMVGHRSNVDKLISSLHEVDGIREECVVTMPFHQGNVTRWGIAWTYYDISFSTVETLDSIKKTHKPPLEYILENIEMNEAVARLRFLLQRIQITVKEINRKDDEYAFEITSYKATWRNQRKRRREEERKLNEAKKIKTDGAGADCQVAEKEVLFEEGRSVVTDDSFSNNESEKPVILHAAVLLKKEDCKNNVILRMTSMGGTGGWGVVHEVLTYFKNHWSRNLI